MPDFSLYYDEAYKILLAAAIGAVIGLERDSRSKAAGFRTMILICVGSCVFTILSRSVGGHSDDRIAAQIVTGIGFLGGGVIFKEGLTISGLTTAALIWVTAAIGMAIGYENFVATALVSGILCLVLFILEPIQQVFNKYYKVKDYRIKVESNYYDFKKDMEEFLKSYKIKFDCLRVEKINHELIYVYRIRARDRKYDEVDSFLIQNNNVKTFEL